MSLQETKEPTLEINGDHLYFQTIGSLDKTKPILVFLHEGLGSIAQWKDFPALLCQKTGLSGFLYERKGYGHSSPNLKKRTSLYLHEEAKTLESVLQKTEIKNPIFIGHSDGGSIALLYKSEIKPKAIVTMAAHVFVEEITLEGIRKAVDIYKTTSLSQKLKKYHFDQTDTLFWSWADTWLSKEFKDWNITKEISHIICPILALQGENDEYGTPEQLKAITKSVVGPVQTQLIPHCAHSPHLEAKEEVIKIISNFIKKL